MRQVVVVQRRVFRDILVMNEVNMTMVYLHYKYERCHPLPSIAANDPLRATDEVQLAASSRSLNL